MEERGTGSGERCPMRKWHTAAHAARHSLGLPDWGSSAQSARRMRSSGSSYRRGSTLHIPTLCSIFLPPLRIFPSWVSSPLSTFAEGGGRPEPPPRAQERRGGAEGPRHLAQAHAAGSTAGKEIGRDDYCALWRNSLFN